MKINKLLFLGIVLVMFNVVYLAAQVTDTVFVSATTAKPGDTLSMSVSIDINSTGVNGIIINVGLDSTLFVNLDTANGAWYTYGAGFGQVLKDNEGLTSVPLIKFDRDARSLTIGFVGYNIDQYAQFALLPADKKGVLANFKFHVASGTPEGNYAVTAYGGADGFQLLNGQGVAFSFPVLSGNTSIMVANIPDYNALQSGAAIGTAIGDTLKVPVKVENKDSVASGSFTLDYPSSLLTFGQVVAGTRGAGATFTPTVTTVNSTTKKVSVSFSGASLAPGGLGDLCWVAFSTATASKTTNQVILASVVLKGPSGSNVANLQQPTVATTALNFFYGDSLIVDLKAGDFSAIDATNRRVTVPIRLVNSVPVSGIQFNLRPDPLKPAGILKIYDVLPTSLTSSWMISKVDSTLLVLAYTGSTNAIPAGNHVVFNVVLSIKGQLTTTQLPMDVATSLTGVAVTNATGTGIAVEQVGGTVSLDNRVPNDGEAVGPGTSLPKVFALSQNAPNPFNPSTTIDYQIPESAGAGVSFSLNVYDMRGSLVKTLAEGFKGPGSYKAYWDGVNNHGQQVSSGVYFYRFSSAKYTSTRKMILLK